MTRRGATTSKCTTEDLYLIYERGMPAGAWRCLLSRCDGVVLSSKAGKLICGALAFHASQQDGVHDDVTSGVVGDASTY